MLGYDNPAPKTDLVHRKRGPKRSKLNNLLEPLFKKSGEKANKQNFLTYLLRSFRKILKNISDLNSAKIKILEGLDTSKLKSKLRRLDTQNLLKSLSGPLNTIKSFTQFFHQDEAKTLYTLIINQVVKTNDWSLINKRLNLKCCIHNNHTTCQRNSLYLKNHLKDDFLSELNSNNSSRDVVRSRSRSPSNIFNIIG